VGQESQGSTGGRRREQDRGIGMNKKKMWNHKGVKTKVKKLGEIRMPEAKKKKEAGGSTGSSGKAAKHSREKKREKPEDVIGGGLKGNGKTDRPGRKKKRNLDTKTKVPATAAKPQQTKSPSLPNNLQLRKIIKQKKGGGGRRRYGKSN